MNSERSILQHVVNRYSINAKRVRRRNAVACFVLLATSVESAPALAQAPLNYLTGAGPRNVSTLTWGVLIIAICVVVATIVILLVAMLRGSRPSSPEIGERAS